MFLWVTIRIETHPAYKPEKKRELMDELWERLAENKCLGVSDSFPLSIRELPNADSQPPLRWQWRLVGSSPPHPRLLKTTVNTFDCVSVRCRLQGL